MSEKNLLTETGIKTKIIKNTSNNIFLQIQNNEIKPNNKISLNINQLNTSNYSKKKRNKNNSIIISNDTLIYSLPFLLNDKTKKNKNYERISFELKNLFNLRGNNNINYIIKKDNNKDNNKDNKKDNNKDNNKNKNNNSIDFEDTNNILEYIRKIKIPPNQRTMVDIYLIYNWLSKTKLAKYFKEEFDDNNEIYEKLITFCSIEIKHKKFFSGQKIFNIGDLPDYFYIILQGKIDIVKPRQKKVSLSGNQYFYYLMNLLKNGDNYTFNLCIENNKKNFIIEQKDIELLPYIFISMILEKININYPIDFNEILSIVNIDPIKFGLTEIEAYDNSYLKENTDKILKCFPYKINSDLIEKYYFIFDKYEKKDIIIYENVKFLSLETNDYFGDSALDSKTTRNATIIASEDTDVGYLEMNLYQSYIGEEKNKIIKKQINFLLQNFFFKKINPKKFQKKYFGYFICNNYKKGDILYKEDENPKYAFFIEEGRVELSSSKNILEMELTIEALNKKLKNINTIIKNRPESDDIDNNEKDENNNEIIIDNGDDEFLYNKINNNYMDLFEQINKKENNKILFLKKNEDLGIISFYFDYPYITNCIVSSTKAKIFKIDIKYLSEIMSYEQNCLYDLNKRVQYRLTLFKERFFNLNNTKLLIADKKESFKLEEISKNENIIKKNKLLNKNDIIYNKMKKNKYKTKIDINKFKELYKKMINKNNENNNSNDSKLNKNLIKSTLPSIRLKRVIIFNHNTPKNILKDNSINSKSWRNKTIYHHRINLQKIKNYSREKDNTIKFLEYNNNKSDKNIYKKRMNIDSSINNTNSIYFQNTKINKQLNNNNNELRRNKNDSFIRFFEKYLTYKNSLPNNIPLIFSKKKLINIEDNTKISNDKIEYTSDNKCLNINNINEKSYTNIIRNKFWRNSRNSSNSLFSSINNINSFSSNKKTNNLNDISNKINFLLYKKNKNILPKKNDYDDSIHIKNKNKYIIKDKNINSYADKRRSSKCYINNKKKHIDHPYYSPGVLTKREKYKIFMINDYTKKPNRLKIDDFKKISEFEVFPLSSNNKNNIENNSLIFKYKKVL